MNAEDREKAEALRLVLSRYQLFPPSSDELYRAMDEVLPLVRKRLRGIPPREDQTSIL
jgi:hypothetical protein